MKRLAAILLLACWSAPSPALADDDVVLYEMSPDNQGELPAYNLLNLLSRSVFTGIVGNSARNGLGTDNETGPALASEGLYYQGLRIYSYFDQAFQRALLDPKTPRPLPDRFVMLAGRFPESITRARVDEERAAITKFRKVAGLLVPEVKPFSFRRFLRGDFELDLTQRRLRLSDALRNPNYTATQGKLVDLAQKTYRANASPVRDKLTAMIGAFAPLSTQFFAGFDDQARQRSFTRLRVILPAYHTLVANNTDRAETWFLEKGLKPHILPKPVQIMMAQITGLRYLQEADRSQHQAIALELNRDFDQTDRLTLVARFGVLTPSTDGSLLTVETSDPRNALYVTFRPHLAAAPGDDAVVKWTKARFNDVFGVYEVDARVHELTLRMIRSAATDNVFRPYFSLDESKISFRVHRRGLNFFTQLSMRALGFTCSSASSRYNCWQDYWTWDNFSQQMFMGRLASTSGLTSGIQRLINQSVGFATREVLDRSIPNIEDAIDNEVGRLGDVLLDRVTTARATVTDRLHSGLF